MLSGHSKATIVVNSVFPFLAILAVALRLVARRLKNVSFKADDYTIIGATVRLVLDLLTCDQLNMLQIMTVGNSMPNIYCTFSGSYHRSSLLIELKGAIKGGLGEHIDTLNPNQLIIFGKVCSYPDLRIRADGGPGYILDPVHVYLGRLACQIFDSTIL